MQFEALVCNYLKSYNYFLISLSYSSLQQMATAKIGNAEIYYEIYGEGRPLLLVAGLASDSQSWLSIIPELSKKYRLIVFDNRGVGRSKPMDETVSISQMADDVMGLVRYLNLQKVSLAGHSMGGMVALELAIRHPEIVTNLILVSTSSVNSARNAQLFDDFVSYLKEGMSKELWFKNLFYWIFSKKFFENEESVKTAIQLSINYPFPQSEIAFANQVEAIRNFNLSDSLSSVKSKTLVIGGEEDILFSPDEVYNSLKSIKGSKFSFIEGAAHSVFVEKPVEFVMVVNDFMENI